ncbi:MAG TPA: TolC family protein, partial [Candidatus Eremiobacteraeota bacterium]|nr:TolC family protein [Candidatus Eremiobacteraeota bacterium]
MEILMFRKKVYILLLVVILTLPSSISLSRDIQQLTLSDCISMAMETNVSIIKARDNIRVAEAGKRQSLSTFYPSIQFSSQYSRTNANTTFISGAGTVVSSPARQSGLATFIIKQRIFDSFRTWNNYKLSEAQLQNAEYALKEAAKDLALAVARNYFQLSEAKHLVELTEVLLNQANKHFEQTNANYQAGISPKSDIYSAQVNVTQAKVNLLEAQNNLNIQKANLRKLIGLERSDLFEITDEKLELNYKAELQEGINKALQDRPELNEMMAQIEAQNRQIDLLTLNVMPQLTIDLGLNLDAYRDPSLSENAYTVSANFTLPLFDGFSSKAKIDAAEANMNSLQAQERDMKRSISLEVETDYYKLETAFAKI